MKLQFRSFVLALAMVGAAIAVHAQNGAASKADIARCTDWLKTVVPDTMKVDVALFCAGQKQEQVPGLGGWYSTYHCGPAARPAADGKQAYCSASGSFDDDYTIAAGFTSGTGRGGDLFPVEENGDGGAPATLYTRTPVQIGAMRLPAGLYRLTISHPSDGWKMTLAPEAGGATRVAALKPDGERVSSADSGLAIAVHHSGTRCGDPMNVRELIFTLNGLDLYACLRPEHIPPTQEGVASR